MRVYNIGGGGSVTLPAAITYTAPSAVSTWTALNTPTTADLTGGGIRIASAAQGGGVFSNKALVKTAPGTPWVFTCCIDPLLFVADYGIAGLCFRSSAADDWATFHLISETASLRLSSSKWTSATTFDSNYQQSFFERAPSPIWLRIEDNGTNRICSYSVDNRTYTAWHSVIRTDFLTADQYGFFVDAATASSPVEMIVHSAVLS